MEIKMKAYERFLKYVSFPTASDETTGTTPSTKKQLALAEYLKNELTAMGVECELDEYGYVYASLPATKEGVNSVGFIAHMDTSSEAPDSPIKAKIVEYSGGDILLNEEKNIYMTEADNPSLKKHIGERLIVTDGTTLLGADDKAGIAEIITAVELLKSSGLPHGKISIAFTPDEEIGEGADHFDVARFGADYAYTVDGGALGELEYENFNAASAKVTVHGVSYHPGAAKGKMKNAIRILTELTSILPTGEIPEETEGYEGFYHLLSMSGACEKAEAAYIIRDHDTEKFEEKKKVFESAVETLNEKYGDGTCEVKITDSYYNMKRMIEKNPFIVERAKAAFRSLGVEPLVNPIRGGTDGARLSFMGLPCPNLCTGGENFHSRFEFACVDSMEKISEIIFKIAQDVANGKKETVVL